MNEITLKLKCSVAEIKEILKNKNFNIESSYILDDTYYVLQDVDISILPIREILNKAILLRNIEEQFADMTVKQNTKLTYKQKEFAKNGDIINQSKVECEVTDIQDARKFIETIGYKKLMNIKENGTIFTNGELEIDVKDIINGDKLIEVELSEKFNAVDRLKEELNRLQLPIDTTNYFVKKAEVELEKLLK